MSDIITRLLLKTNEFDTNLNNAKQSVNSFQGGISNASKVAGAGIAKFAGAIGLALGSYEAFDKLIHSSQGTQDAFEWRMAACKESVDMFFHSLASGDFTAFNQGVLSTYDNLIKLQQLRDDFADAKISTNVFRAQYNYDSQRLKAVISDNGSTKAQKKAAADELRKITEKYSGQISKTNDLNVNQMIQNAQTKTGRYFGKEDVIRFFKVYNNPASLDDRKSKFDEYIAQMNALKSKEYSHQITNTSAGAITREVANPEVQKQIRQLQKENNELDRMYILSQHNDKTWEELSTSVIEYYGAKEEAERNLNFLVKQQNKVDKSKSGDGKSDADSPSGSLAYFDAEIAKKNKALSIATTAQARAAVQTTINELESRKLSLKISVNKSVFGQTHLEKDNKESSKIEEIENTIVVYDNLILKKKKDLSTEISESTHATIESEIKKLESTTNAFNSLISINKTKLSNETNESVRSSIKSEITKLESTVSLFDNLILTKKTALSNKNYNEVRSTVESEIKTMENTVSSFNDLISINKTKLSNETNESVRSTIESEIKELESATTEFVTLISTKKAELIEIASKSFQSPIQEEIKKLESTKISLQAEITVLKVEQGDKMKSSILDGYNNNHRDDKGNKTDADAFKKGKLPKFKSPVSKKDIKLNEEYNDTLAAMGSIMGSLSGAFDGNTQSVLQWGITLLTTIGQAIPAIASMIPIKKQDANASKEEASAAMLNGAAKTVEAHASIPFAGIAIGLAGVASIIAVLSSMPKFATGGVVPGVSFTGDKVPAWLNSGEMILNGGQQANLFRMLNAGLYAGITAEQVQPNMGNVSRFIMPDESAREIVISGTLRANGSVLETVLNNYTHKKSKVR